MHRRKKFGPIRVKEGTEPELVDNNPERTIDTVCHTCNNTWMSRLEEKNIPALGDMLDNKHTAVDEGRQRLLAEWALKTAMVLDSIKSRHGDENFYTRDECRAMRISQEIPKETRIWVGALTEPHLGAFGTDFTILGGDRARIGTGIANTIVAGHFAVQVVTTHMTPNSVSDGIREVQPNPGDWDNTLIQLRPKAHKTINWPPTIPFTNGGPQSIAFLMQRWRSGEKVSKVTKDGFVR
jgi:hypothetical protein